MTDFLILDGLTVEVAEGSFKRSLEDGGGSQSRSYAGTLQSTVRWEKYLFTFTTGHMLKSEGEALRTAIALNKRVHMTGSAYDKYVRARIVNEIVITAITADTNNWVMQYEIVMRED